MEEYTWQLPQLWNNYASGIAQEYGQVPYRYFEKDGGKYVGRVGGVSISNLIPSPTLQTPQGLGTRDFSKEFTPAKAHRDWHGIGTAALATALFAGDIYNTFGNYDSVSDLMQEAGRSEGITRGVGYEVLNRINRAQKLSENSRLNVSNTIKSVGSGAAAGAAIGSIVPGIGTAIGAVGGGIIGGIGGAIGGIFSRNKEKDRIKAQLQLATRTTNFNRDVAATTGMRMDFNKKYGDPSGLILHAKLGKDYNTMTNSYAPGIVHTVHGLMPGIQNAWGNKGETMVSMLTPDAHLITDGPNDTAPAYASDDVAMLGAMIDPATGMSYAKEGEPHTKQIEYIKSLAPKTKDKVTIDTYNKAAMKAIEPHYKALLDIADRQQYHRNMLGYNNYMNMMRAKNGKDALPKMKLGGPFSNAFAGGLGLAASIAQYFDARNQRSYRPNTYVRNPYLTRALAELDALRVSPYPIIQQMRAAEARGRSGIARSGGLSAAQKYLANVATTANTQSGIADALYKIQTGNLGYRSNAAQARLQAGAQDAANRMNALRADNEIYMRSHAARQQGMQTGIYNGLAQIQQYLANEYKRRMGNAMIDMYDMDFRNKKEFYKNYGKG